MEHIEALNGDSRLERLKMFLPTVRDPREREAMTWAAGEIERLRERAETAEAVVDKLVDLKYLSCPLPPELDALIKQAEAAKEQP